MKADLLLLYRQMLRSRRFEEVVKDLWEKGKISGEMHLGIGEEAIAAGIVAHLEDGDAMALDHRGTPPMIIRGVDPLLLLREFCGKPDGLCQGMGGHMHLFSKEHLAASSGIVGSSGPLAVGMALAAQYLRTKNLAVAFFGEGAINQGMLMESLNFAVTWKLPVLFVCKDNRWAITTRSRSVTGGNVVDRIRGFGMPLIKVNGVDVEAVWNGAKEGVDRARDGGGPSFLLARCARPEGHFLGDPVLRRQSREMQPLIQSLFTRRGASFGARMAGLGRIVSLSTRIRMERNWNQRDPIYKIRRQLKDREDRLSEIEREVEEEIRQVLNKALSMP